MEQFHSANQIPQSLKREADALINDGQSIESEYRLERLTPESAKQRIYQWEEKYKKIIAAQYKAETDPATAQLLRQTIDSLNVTERNLLLTFFYLQRAKDTGEVDHTLHSQRFKHLK